MSRQDRFTPASAEDWLDDIAEALKAYGGAAHRSLVIDRVQIVRGRRGETWAEEAARAVQEAFERHRDGRGRGLFRLPFGEGSHRWALDQGAV
ncbi:hypothetical protein QO010_004782 [Caulobacter ginsengisoli]|jgi:hypothetical protein|uniref:Uncharacterized protein n=1 Tax=Caulobacter ginsengisoli TaxID=400775 RepID=A0ABU0IYB1_9CAUL|nr:hypothetical protein [Caulobacter ginsengisoli]MDQ0466985.1 hypothetical protein [Caulobacter ginsengisoli]